MTTAAGTVAGFGRRFVALTIDWLLSELVALLFRHQVLTIVVFAVQATVFVAAFGQTPGMRVMGTRVVRLDGRPPNVGWALVRTLLLCLVVPAVLIDGEGRSLHDRATASAVVRE